MCAWKCWPPTAWSTSNLPGYSKNGIGGTLRIVGNALKAKFTDTNDQAIDPYIAPRPEVIAALAGWWRTAPSTDAQPMPPARWASCVDAKPCPSWWKRRTRRIPT